MKMITYWFVKPIGSNANQIIAEVLNGDPSLYHDEIVLNDGNIIRGVWEVPYYSYITDFKKYKETCGFPFEFDIFKKQGPLGKYYQATYLSDLKKQKNPEASTAQEFIKKAKKQKNLSS